MKKKGLPDRSTCLNRVPPNGVQVGLLGAFSRIGMATTAALLQQAMSPRAIRAFSRRPDPQRMPSSPDARFEVQALDLDAPGDWTGAFAGLDSLLLLTADAPQQIARECRAIDAAVRAGVRRIVKISAHCAGHQPQPAFGVRHGAIETHLLGAGCEAVILRPTFFTQSIDLFVGDIARTKRILAPTGSGKIAFVDARDVGDIAARALRDSSVAPDTYVIAGPAAKSFADVAELLGRTVGRKISHVSPPRWLAVLAMRAKGLPKEEAVAVGTLLANLRAGAQSQPGNLAALLAGRGARTVEGYVSERYGAAGSREA